MTLSELIKTMPGLTAETPAEDVLAWVQELVAQSRRIEDGDLRAIAAQHDLRALWEAARDDATVVAGTLTVRALAREGLAVLDRGDGLNMAHPSVPSMLDAMQAVGLLSAEARAALDDAGTAQVPRYRDAGIVGYGDDVSWLYHIERARV